MLVHQASFRRGPRGRSIYILRFQICINVINGRIHRLTRANGSFDNGPLITRFDSAPSTFTLNAFRRPPTIVRDRTGGDNARNTVLRSPVPLAPPRLVRACTLRRRRRRRPQQPRLLAHWPQPLGPAPAPGPVPRRYREPAQRGEERDGERAAAAAAAERLGAECLVVFLGGLLGPGLGLGLTLASWFGFGCGVGVRSAGKR